MAANSTRARPETKKLQLCLLSSILCEFFQQQQHQTNREREQVCLKCLNSFATKKKEGKL